MANALLITGSVAAGAIIIGVGYTIGTYNTFVNTFEDTKNQWSNILTEYQRRADLIINLTKTVKSYKRHEKETLIEVTKARGMLNNATPDALTQKKQIGAMGAIDSMLSKLMVVVEQYPSLKADTLHSELMSELRITEDRINSARTNYNDTVRDYNVGIKEFPARLVAGAFSFSEALFWEIQGTTAHTAPVVDL